MSRTKDRFGLLRWGRTAVAMALLLSAPVALGGCRTVQGFLAGPTPASRIAAAPPSAAEPAPPEPTREAATSGAAAALAVAAPVAAAEAERPVTQTEAQSAVRTWFGDLAAGDFHKAEESTAGEAALLTRQLGDALEQEAGRQGVGIQLVVRRLDLAPDGPSESGEAVQADFEIDVNAVVGPASIRAKQARGGATFIVQRFGGTPKVADIRNATGLPTP